MFNLLIRPTEATNSKDGFNAKKVRQNTVTHKRKFYINETFSWTNTTLSTADGARELRLAFIVSPAKEKIHAQRHDAHQAAFAHICLKRLKPSQP